MGPGCRAFLPVLALAAATPAAAEIDSDLLSVHTTIRAQCKVRAGDLDLGLYEPARASQASSAIELQCTPGVVARIGLSAGRSGDPANRWMQAKGQLRYQLYKDSARTQLFADRNASETVLMTATGLTQRVLVHGEAPAGQYAPEGGYVDVIVVTVTY